MWRRCESVEELREHALRGFEQASGATRVFVDPLAPGVALQTESSSPEQAALPLVVELTGADEDMLASEERILCHHFVHPRVAAPGHLEIREASLPWTSVFCVACPRVHVPGRGEAVPVAFRPDAVPARVRDLAPAGTPDANRAHVGVAILLATLRIDRTPIGDLHPFAIGVPRATLDAMIAEGWARPDKRQALEEILDRAHPGHALIHVNLRAPGVKIPLPTGGADSANIELGRRPPVEDLRITGIHVRFKLRRAGIRHSFVLPWSSIAAVQDPTSLVGWFWTEDLPPQRLASLEQEPELEHLRGRRGAPFLPEAEILSTGEPIVTRLMLAPEPNPRDAVRKAARRGAALVFVDPARDRVRLPPALAAQPFAAIPLARMPGLIPYEVEVSLDGLGFQATVPDPDGGTFRVSIPWDAVFAVSVEGSMRLSHYPEHWPDAVRQASELRRHLDEHGCLPDEIPDGVEARPADPDAPQEIPLGELVLLGAGEGEGRAMIGLVQPMGPEEAGGERAKLMLSLALDDFPAAR